MRLTGTLVEWNDDRGFGFLEPSKGGERAFCHISQFTVRTNRPVIGQRLSYETSRDERGRLRAAKISPIALEPRPKKRPEPAAPASQLSPWIAVFVTTIFLIVIIGLVIANRLPWIVPLIYVIASLLTIFAYAFDKGAAMNQRWRTQESTLHLFALVGGWPGAWIAQLAFRHKTKKTSFVVSFVFCVIANLAVLTWLVVERDGPVAQMLWGIGGDIHDGLRQGASRQEGLRHEGLRQGRMRIRLFPADETSAFLPKATLTKSVLPTIVGRHFG